MSGIYPARPAEPIICTLGNKGTTRCYSDHNGCSLLSQAGTPGAPAPQRNVPVEGLYDLGTETLPRRDEGPLCWAIIRRNDPFRFTMGNQTETKKDHVCFQKVIRATRSNTGEFRAVNTSECRSGKLSLGWFLGSVSLSGAFCRLPAHTIGVCVRGLRNAVRWQGSGIAAW